jgi:hypothetical protein
MVFIPWFGDIGQLVFIIIMAVPGQCGKRTRSELTTAEIKFVRTVKYSWLVKGETKT